MTIKPRTLIKDRPMELDETKIIVEFLSTVPHIFENTKMLIVLALLSEDYEALYEALVGLSVAAIHTWECAEEVDLSGELFKFLGEQNAD